MSFFTWLRMKVKDAFLGGIGDAMETLSLEAAPYHEESPPSLEWMASEEPAEIVIETAANGSPARKGGRRKKS